MGGPRPSLLGPPGPWKGPAGLGKPEGRTGGSAPDLEAAGHGEKRFLGGGAESARSKARLPAARTRSARRPPPAASAAPVGTRHGAWPRTPRGRPAPSLGAVPGAGCAPPGATRDPAAPPRWGPRCRRGRGAPRQSPEPSRASLRVWHQSVRLLLDAPARWGPACPALWVRWARGPGGRSWRTRATPGAASREDSPAVALGGGCPGPAVGTHAAARDSRSVTQPLVEPSLENWGSG